MSRLIGQLSDGIGAGFQRMGTEEVPQGMRGDRLGVLGADLVDPAPVQLRCLPAYEQIWTVCVTLPVSYRKVFPNRMDHLIPQIDDSLLPALSLSNGKLPTGEIDIRQQKPHHFAVPQPRIGKQRHHSVVPLAEILPGGQDRLPEGVYLCLADGAGAGVLQLDFHEVVFEHNGLGLSANLYEPFIVAALPPAPSACGIRSLRIWMR